MKDEKRNGAQTIQRYWKSFHIRRKVILFSSLPYDLWILIVKHIRTQYYLYKNIDTSINMKVIRHYWQPATNIKQKLMTLKLAKKYSECLSKSTIFNIIRIALQLLDTNSHSPRAKMYNAILNSIIEHVVNVFEAKFCKVQ